jgi:AraC-like DNA-binding protein
MLMRESPDFEIWVAVFRRRQVRRIARALQLPVLARLKPVGHFCRIVDAKAASLLSLFMEEMADRRAPAPLLQFNTAMDWLLMEAWRRFDASRDLPVNADIHPAIQRLTAILRDEPDLSTLQQMSQRVGMSPAWLSRLFQSQMKISIPGFRNRQRLAAFLALYRTGGRYNLTQAALEAGFQSYLQFYRVFIGLMGITPRQFAAARRDDAQADFPIPENRGMIRAQARTVSPHLPKRP